MLHHENSYLLQCYPVSIGALFPVNTAFFKPSVLHLQVQSVQEGGLVNSYWYSEDISIFQNVSDCLRESTWCIIKE